MPSAPYRSTMSISASSSMFAPTLILNPSFVSDFSRAMRRNSFLWMVRWSLLGQIFLPHLGVGVDDHYPFITVYDDGVVVLHEAP